jgi:tubulin monoglycylase TTLL15
MKVSVESHLKAQGDHHHSMELYTVELDWLLKYHFFLFKGRDATKIWDQLEDAIRVVCLEKESKIRNLMKNYKSKTNFFEMARFDFVVDNDLNVFIMEAS